MKEVMTIKNHSRKLDGPVAMYQRWRDLGFLHWQWDKTDIAKRLPPGLELDLFDGQAYLGVVPFRMEGVRPAGLPPVPGISDFPELNLRTYVRDRHGRPGVWFFSLDAGHWLAVVIARKFFYLPYFTARMQCREEQEIIRYRSQRQGSAAQDRIDYHPLQVPAAADKGSLDEFLVERYRFFSWHKKQQRLLTGQVAHEPYLISPAAAPLVDLVLWENDGFVAPGCHPELIHYSPGVDVLASRIRPVV